MSAGGWRDTAGSPPCSRCCSCCGLSLKSWDWGSSPTTYRPRRSRRLSWTQYAEAAALAVTIVCVAIGIRFWPSGRARSYRWYIRAALVSIFITQVFVFFDSQLVAVVGLAVNVLIYASLNFMANLEAGVHTFVARRGQQQQT